jgi:hypothetical protein
MRPLDQDVNPAGWARVQFVRDLPDGRRFANDSRGTALSARQEQSAKRLPRISRACFRYAIYNRLESG